MKFPRNLLLYITHMAHIKHIASNMLPNDVDGYIKQVQPSYNELCKVKKNTIPTRRTRLRHNDRILTTEEFANRYITCAGTGYVFYIPYVHRLHAAMMANS